MYKLKILAIIAIAIVGALLIYNHFDKKTQEQPVIDKFSSEYNLVTEDHIFKYKSIDEIIDILDNKTGVIFFCTPESNWCNKYASIINTTLKENGIEEINYYNIKRDRELNTVKYQKILDKLNPFIFKDDSNNMKLYMPNLTFVRNGEVVANDNETSLIASDIEVENYWTQEKQDEFKNKIINYIGLLNEEELEEGE
jgi:hypothetical protein